jgi:hypothetical protein
MKGRGVMHATPRPEFLNRPDFEPTIPYILAAAAQYLLTFGWTSSHIYDADGSDLPAATAIGAIYEVCQHFARTELSPNVFGIDDINGFRWFKDAGEYFIAYITAHADAESIGEWNDDPCRTADEVIEYLLLAADSCRSSTSI